MLDVEVVEVEDCNSSKMTGSSKVGGQGGAQAKMWTSTYPHVHYQGVSIVVHLQNV